MNKEGNIYIGTSGWHYKHWVGPFYPEGIKDNEQLSFYQQHFRTVEINNSFYNLPLATTFKNWRAQTPDNFLFAVKGSRYISHLKKLRADKQSILKFLHRADKLEEKLGPVLFQLPPRWRVNTERLGTFLSKLPGGYRYTFEFRDETWYTDEVYDLLKRYNCAFCIYELAGHKSPETITADFVYVRLHGPGAKYQGNYSTAVLRAWAKKITGWARSHLDVHVYFDNDQAGYAALNAGQLIRLVMSAMA